MPVLTFPVAGRDNCVVVAGTAYVYATVGGRGFVMRAQCPHRSGPLHLADVTEDADRLVCPWHERKTSVARLRAEIPAVRAGDRVTAVFPDRPPARGRSSQPTASAGSASSAPSTPRALHGEETREYRPLSPELARPGPAG
ncbi:Rieske 2Fe-2S domain-containing protein [Streptomyces sp. TRM49041]|uniref:Rieske 2Fe-2S domain-containing protein n=1 Tax=Streptomyces sp. TRM49041 TaxID=2603216 RepID=UPI0011F004B2|nr:Rieske 2Fe-2S domain-containing protein [Streptomyces sp. TRM49041]